MSDTLHFVNKGRALRYASPLEQIPSFHDWTPDPTVQVTVNEGRWHELVHASLRLQTLSVQATNTRVWNPNYIMMGLLGEEVYGVVSSRPLDLSAKITNLSDGGEDFPGVDVKATNREPPLLMRLRTDPLKAGFYALVHVALERRRGSYVGYATRSELDAAPDVEYGHGPTRTLTVEHLHPTLPPS